MSDPVAIIKGVLNEHMTETHAGTLANSVARKLEAAGWLLVGPGVMQDALEQALGCWMHHYGANPELVAEPIHIAALRAAAASRYGSPQNEPGG